MSDTTPMMQQYERIKSMHREKILFFRLGDFYEMFRNDAREASRILGLTLTARNGIPMCGIPFHAAQSYIPKLLDAGKKVAICEQTRMPEDAKGIAERQVVEVITPGTVMDENYLPQGQHNYIGSISRALGDSSRISLSFIDISTGDIVLSAYRTDDQAQLVLSDIEKFRPREILLQESLAADQPWLDREMRSSDRIINRYPDWHYQSGSAARILTSVLGVQSLKAFGLEESSPELDSLGPLLRYVEENAGRPIVHLNSIQVNSSRDFMHIDGSSQKNLELVRNIQDGSETQSLFKVIDQTRTSMGRRLLRTWILHPLIREPEIIRRQKRVSVLYHDQLCLNKLRDILGGALDLPRLASRVSMEKAHPKDLRAIMKSIEGFLDSYRLLRGGELEDLFPADDLPVLRNRADLIASAIVDEPPTTLTDGGIIRKGYNEELDELKGLEANAQQLLDEYLENERVRSGIANLKLKFNRVIGYFLEVSKGQLKLVPETFERRQSLVNADRFTTPELSRLAERITTAREEAKVKEQELFLHLRTKINEILRQLQRAGSILAELDCLQSFSYQATLRGYTCPKITDDQRISITGGRHPVVETFIETGAFVANDLEVSADGKNFFTLITGPNMAGKSTYLRQNALIILMAQIGSFVPAESAEIGICDRIFCRVGASDNLARGESTFLVEMNETAHILRQAGTRSLVIMDEVGRGTSTQDGLSIAWAVCEYILGHLRCRTLFATHFHELSELANPGLVNRSLAVKDDEGEILFLNKVVDGPSNNSYGIHVARIAGIPDEVIFRAGEILEEIQRSSGKVSITQSEQARRSLHLPSASRQRGLFGQDEMVVQEIMHMDLDSITPIEALNHLHRMQKNLKD
jgi:DNA mismatch repair protein MutS